MTSQPSTVHLLQLPAELLQAVLDKLDGCTLVLLEATCKVFQSLKQDQEGEEALGWTEWVARRKTLELRRQLDLPMHYFARSACSFLLSAKAITASPISPIPAQT